jgi:hypothetical protein
MQVDQLKVFPDSLSLTHHSPEVGHAPAHSNVVDDGPPGSHALQRPL